MRLVILRQTSIAGQPARVDDVVEADARDAWLLINSGKAKLAPAAAEVQPLAEDPKPITRKPRSRRSKTHGTA